MIYEFIHEPTGEIVEVHFPMGSAPTIGEEILHGGRIVRRIASTKGNEINTHPNSSQYPYVSNALPRTIARDGSCKLVREKKGSRRLKPLVESARHERELMAKFDLVKGL